MHMYFYMKKELHHLLLVWMQLPNFKIQWVVIITSIILLSHALHKIRNNIICLKKQHI